MKLDEYQAQMSYTMACDVLDNSVEITNFACKGEPYIIINAKSAILGRNKIKYLIEVLNNKLKDMDNIETE